MSEPNEPSNPSESSAPEVARAAKWESLAHMAAHTGHDLNNYCMAILGNASLAAMDISEGHPSFKYLKQVELAASRTSEFAREMLHFAGKDHYTLKPVDLSALIHGMSDIIPASHPPNHHFEIERALGHPMVNADATQLRLAIMNLIQNAVEACAQSPGNITLRTGICSDFRTLFSFFEREGIAKDCGFIEVIDHGTGMTPDVLSCAFDPFFSTKHRGRGMGLCAVIGTVRSHRGAVEVVTGPGEGTSVRLLFPILREQ